MRSKTRELEEKVKALEKRVEELEKRPAYWIQPIPYYVPIYTAPVWPSWPYQPVWCGGGTVEIGSQAVAPFTSGNIQTVSEEVKSPGWTLISETPNESWSYTTYGQA